MSEQPSLTSSDLSKVAEQVFRNNPDASGGAVVRAIYRPNGSYGIVQPSLNLPVAESQNYPHANAVYFCSQGTRDDCLQQVWAVAGDKVEHSSEVVGAGLPEGEVAHTIDTIVDRVKETFGQ